MYQKATFKLARSLTRLHAPGPGNIIGAQLAELVDGV